MIRPAKLSDIPELTGLSSRSKGYWGYPAHYFEIWQKELTVAEDDLASKIIFVHGSRHWPVDRLLQPGFARTRYSREQRTGCPE